MQTFVFQLFRAWQFLRYATLPMALFAAMSAAAADLGPVIWRSRKFDIREFDTPFIQVAAGPNHTVALRKDGRVAAWGSNISGQTTVPTGLSNVIAIAAGGAHTVALKSDGTVVAWGSNGFGQTKVPGGLSNVIAIAAGSDHTVALKSDGTVVAWGYNASGQTTVPADLSNVIAIAAGGSHTVALKSDGTVVAWGHNGADQATVPAGLNGVTAIAAGISHTLALKSDGTLVAWGHNGSGETTVPTGLSNVAAIAAGGSHTVALKSDGTVVAWGHNGFGQTTVPAGLDNVTAITTGWNHTVALKSDGTVMAWGERNAYGETTTPASLGDVTAIAAGDHHFVALRSDGTVMAWGRGLAVQEMPANLSGVTAIASGIDHSLVLKNDGTVVAWGDNRDGKTAVPAGLSGVTAVAAGFFHSVALRNDGTVVAWGLNLHNQTRVPLGLNGVTAIAAGGGHTVALRSDGTVVAWGLNSYGQATVPVGLSGVIAIAAGGQHTVALKSDGTVVTWGDNRLGQTNVPAGLRGVTAVVAGENHTASLKSNGTVVSWGDNAYGQTTVPAGLSGVRAVVAGRNVTAAMIALRPSLTTGPAAGISASGATLNGVVNPSGYNSVVSFEYGLTTDYGMSVDATPAAVTGWADQAVSAVLSGLQPRATYYYRVVATNGFGATYGEQRTFSTSNTTPVAGVDAVNASDGRMIALDVLANDGDEDGDSLALIEVAPGQHGTVAMRGGRIFYTPDPGFSGEDTFTYTVSDGFGGTATGTVTVTVPERPQDPVATLLSAKGQPVPGAGVEGSGTEALPVGSTWATFGAPAINGAGQIAFAATVRAGKATHAGVFTYDAEEESYTLEAKKGDAVPELPGAVFASLNDPVLDEAGRVAFVATLSGAGVKKASNGAILTTAYGDLQLIARKGDQPPGAPEGAKWTSFQSLVLPDGVAGPLFVGKMTGNRRSGITPANDVGLWGADSNGTVRLLLQEGQAIEGRKLKSFVVLSSVASVTGQTRSFNTAGEVIVRAHFTDGSQGLVTVQIP